MNRKLWLMAGMTLLPLALVAAVCGDETTRIETTGNDQVHGISVTGEGKVSAAPDLAIVSLGVSALRPSVAEAREAAAVGLQGMIDAMRSRGIEEKDIQTSNLSIYPEYDYRGDTQTLRGFRVTNQVTAKIRDIDVTGDVIDAAVAAGGNDTTINSIAFTIDDPESLREEARRAAVEDARRKADVLAQASGVSVGEPISISEGSVAYPEPVYADRAALDEAAQAGGATPIQEGELDVIVNVTVTWNIE